MRVVNPLQNRVARRIFVEFVLVLVLPLIALSWLGMRQASRQLEEQAFTHLSFAAKDTAMSVVSRVQAIELDVEMILGDLASTGNAPVADANERQFTRLRQSFQDLSIHLPQGRIDLIGSIPELPRLSDSTLEHIASGNMTIEGLPDGRLIVVRNLVEFGLGDGALVGVLRPEQLLLMDGVQGLSLLCDRRPLVTTDPELFTPEVLAALPEGEMQRFQLDLADGAYFAVRREVFLRPQYGRNLTVLLAEPVQSTLAPIAQFRLVFQLTALLAFLLVFLVSLKRVHANLLPISALHAATQRLAGGDLDARLDIHTGDEFQDLGAAFNSMADRVRERTRQLIEANRAKDRFLANVSHEIRTPMNSILGYADLCASEPGLPAELGDNLDVIRTSSRHLLRVINDVLDFARMEAGKLDVQRQPCDPRAVVAEAIRIVEPQLRAKDLYLRSDVASDVPARVLTDPDRLRQILVNLLSNAAKFTAKGGVTVQVENRALGGAPGLCIQVTDTGVGIDDALMQRLFQPFSLGDESMSRKHGGTGLGLSIARALARLLGGDLACTSRFGQGSTFTLTLSAQACPDELPSVRESAAPAGPSAPLAARPALRLLLAEDVAVNRCLAARHLASAGHHIDEAENGSEALERALAAWRAGEPFDLVLMDMQMPVMDGYQAVRELRAAGYTGAILAFTAHALEGERERCLAIGCDELVTKPIVRATLLDAVARHARRPEPPGPIPGIPSQAGVPREAA